MYECLFFVSVLISLTVITFCTLFGVQLIAEWIEDNKMPLLTEDATVLSKQEEVIYNHQLIGDCIYPVLTIDHYVTFIFKDGTKVKLLVPEKTYYKLEENMVGRLTYQGNKYREFFSYQTYIYY